MAENVLETRILLRYGTYSQWMNSNVILKQGEAAIAAFPDERVIDALSDITPEHTPPAIGIKIGDGQHYFYELPWVQAVAADVYKWAKSATKPTYTASEITGLQSFIEETFHFSGDINIAPRIYQIVEGTNDNANKFYLRYKENNDESPWIVDTNHSIDLTQYKAIADWIGVLVNNFPTMGTFTGSQMNSKISALNNNDSAVNSQFVTAVHENKGLISIERAQPDFSDITGVVPIEKGGTGRSSLTLDHVLVGNGTEPVQLIPIADTIASNNYLVPNYLVKQYVDNATAGLTGAMHFIGEATVVIVPNSVVNPQINGYDFGQAEPGDVILSGNKEYVWTGGSWSLLGDEGSYAVKGSIVNVDISEEANIAQSKIAGLQNSLDLKVDKVEGKVLSSNDFTDELKEKLEGIDNGSSQNMIEHIFLNNSEIMPSIIEGREKSINLIVREFTEADSTKLSAIETGAQVNKIEKIIYDGIEITPDANRTVTITSDPHTDHINKIEQIFINGVEWAPNTDKQVNITIDQAALNLNVLEGAQIPNGNSTEDIPQISKKLQLARIAATGNVQDLKQTINTYITLDCGSSTEVI